MSIYETKTADTIMFVLSQIHNLAQSFMYVGIGVLALKLAGVV